MTHPARPVLERLRAVDWSDVDEAYRHENSRARLMREYLRRAALWAHHYGAEQSWPFFDLAEHVDPTVQTPDDIAAELDEVLRGVGPFSVETTCRGAVRWAALGAESKVDLPDLPDPYEPLLALYERGGGFFVEEFIDLNGAMIQLAELSSYLSAPLSSRSHRPRSTLLMPRARSRITRRSAKATREAARAVSSGAGSTTAGRTTRRSRATSAGNRRNTSGCTNSATTRSTTSRSPRSRPPPSSNRRRRGSPDPDEPRTRRSGAGVSHGEPG